MKHLSNIVTLEALFLHDSIHRIHQWYNTVNCIVIYNLSQVTYDMSTSATMLHKLTLSYVKMGRN